MGCFNKIGFYSKLPIFEGNDIVYFPCLYAKNLDIDDCPIDIEYPLIPLCLPIIGKYNDYGSITDIESNSGKHIKDFFGISAENFVEYIENFDNHKEHGTIPEECQWMVEFDKKLFEMIDKNYNKYIKYDFQITYTIERLDVYNKISSMNFKGLYVYKDKDYDYDETFNELYSIISNNKIPYNITTGNYPPFPKFMKDDRFKYESMIVEHYRYLIYSDIGMCCNIYNDEFIYEDYIKEHIRKFNKFNRGLSFLCGRYDVSTYGYQDLNSKHHLNYFKDINDEFDRILSKLIENA